MRSVLSALALGLIVATSARGATPGVWEAVPVAALADGDFIQSVLADPANPGTFYLAAGNNDGRFIKWLRSTDFGATWTLRNADTMHGNPWGVGIDPNPDRPPGTPPTLYSPAGYGSFGAWKSTDGAATWTRLSGADVAFAPFNPFGDTLTDLYQIAVLPDDPPNHLLATYHYGFKNSADGGFGESTDGGATWTVHPPPPGIGTSHYVMPMSAATWCVIAQSNDGANGIWRTTTAGRVGGSVSPLAWTKVSSAEHAHGSFTPARTASGVWYAPAWVEIVKSSDLGATWDAVASGNWPGTFQGVRATAIAATAAHLYLNYFSDSTQARATLADDTQWDLAYAPATDALGSNPFGSASALDAASGSWVVLMGDHARGIVWRYFEPSAGVLFVDGFE